MIRLTFRSLRLGLALMLLASAGLGCSDPDRPTPIEPDEPYKLGDDSPLDQLGND
jgi:hypothetical protein